MQWRVKEFAGGPDNFGAKKINDHMPFYTKCVGIIHVTTFSVENYFAFQNLGRGRGGEVSPFAPPLDMRM